MRRKENGSKLEEDVAGLIKRIKKGIEDGDGVENVGEDAQQVKEGREIK